MAPSRGLTHLNSRPSQLATAHLRATAFSKSLMTTCHSGASRGRCNSSRRFTTCAVQSSTEQLGCTDSYFDSKQFIGPIEVCEIEGKGRGVITAADVAPGELLICCRPLGVVTGPQQTRLSVEQLQVHLASNYNHSTHHWLQQLYDGSEDSTAAAVRLPGPQQQHQQQHLAAHHQGIGSNGSRSSSSSWPTSVSSAVPAVTDAVLQRLMDVVRYNAYGDLHDDLAAAAVAGEEPVALIGLWPEFSMLNHSCVPNAANWVLPGVNRAMVVRAARHIPAGEEVTISYLGAPQLLPLDGRREALSTAFGFNCGCPRCRAEEDIPNSLADLMEDIVTRVSQSFAPRLKKFLSSSGGCDTQELTVIRTQAGAMMTTLYQQLRRHMIHPSMRQQLLASCFSCLEVIADIDMAVGDHSAAAVSLSRCLTAAVAVTPGSDLHVILASKHEAVQQQVPSTGVAQIAAAHQTCVEAHRLRYGRHMAEEVLMQLAELNRSLYV